MQLELGLLSSELFANVTTSMHMANGGGTMSPCISLQTCRGIDEVGHEQMVQQNSILKHVWRVNGLNFSMLRRCRPMYRIFHVGLLMFVPAMVQFHNLNISFVALFTYLPRLRCV